MNVFFSEINFRTESSSSRALVAVQSDGFDADEQLAHYMRKHRLALIGPAKFNDALSLRRDELFTPLHAHLMRKIGESASIAFLVLNEASAQESVLVSHSFDPAAPLLIVFNTARNLAQYRRLRLDRYPVVPLAGFTDDITDDLPATVGVPFSEWTDEASKLYETLDAPFLLLDPPLSLTEPSFAPAFLLMAGEPWSLSHPLDTYWWRTAPVIDAESANLAGTPMFRMLRPSGGAPELGYIGRALFDFDIVRFSETQPDNPICPAARLIQLACETALAHVYLDGVDFGFLETEFRRQAGIPLLAPLGGVNEVLDRLVPFIVSAVHSYRIENGNLLDYQIIHQMAASFGLAAEKDMVEEVAQRWQGLCGFKSTDLPVSLSCRQRAQIFFMENSK